MGRAAAVEELRVTHGLGNVFVQLGKLVLPVRKVSSVLARALSVLLWQTGEEAVLFFSPKLQYALFEEQVFKG